MTTKPILIVLLVISIGMIGTTITYAEKPDTLTNQDGSNIPEHVDLPHQAMDNAKIFNERIIEFDGFTAIIKPLATTYTYPPDHETTGTTQARLSMQRTDGVAGCSGTLIDSIHVLTAGHCITDEFGNVIQDPDITSKAFFLVGEPREEIVYEIAQINVHPNFDGKPETGYDITIMTLNETADSRIPIIPIDRTKSDDINSLITVKSFGVGGYGHEGNDPSKYPFGIEREGLTQVDATGDTMYQALGMTAGIDYEPEFVLQTDFDNGGTNTDAFGYFFGINQLGTGTDDDASTCFGDSGGAIYNQFGEATGVNSYVISLEYFGTTTDVTPELDCSFGEFTGHTRVSQHTVWIDGFMNEPEPEPDPEPTLTCGEGTILDESTNQCVVDPEILITCGEGTILDESTNQCIVENPITCGTGTVLNTETNQCEAESNGKGNGKNK